MKRLSILLFLFFPFFILTKNVDAKLLPQAAKAGTKQPSVKISTGIIVSPRLRRDRRALIVYFSNLQNTKSVSYSLTYKTSEQEEGAMGALKLDGIPTASQELLFGTCSKNVCRYHTGISNARLEVAYALNSGKKYLKRFKIKV